MTDDQRRPGATPRPTTVTVAVPIPRLGLLSYSLPPTLPAPRVGVRVLVPLGGRLVTGCVVPDGEAPVPDEVKPIADLFDAEPWLPPAVVDLALWVAEYYGCGPGEAIAAAMPPRAWVASERQATLTGAGRAALASGVTDARRAILDRLADGDAVPVAALGRRLGGGVHALVAAMAREGLLSLAHPLKGQASAFHRVRVARATGDGLALLDGARLGPRQRQALETLRDHPDGVRTAALTAAGVPAATVRALEARGAVTSRQVVEERDPWDTAATLPEDGGPPRALGSLTAEQRVVVETLGPAAGGGRFQVGLLHGVTGSGKTEVYLRLTADTLGRGRQALILVPEIGLTPVIAGRFRAAFGDRVAIQHSGLSDGARHDQWHRIRRGEVDVVVGTRSAVFAPLTAVGLIVVDEEHDGSYKQEESPRYHGRDVAVMRAKRAGALVLLGSATPSLESYRHARAGRYRLCSLPRRVAERPLPAVHVVDMREELAERGPDAVLSAALSAAIGDRLSAGEQALVLLNRRGFATSVFCRQCGQSLECPNCSVSLTFHRRVDQARCHYCGYSRRRPAACPDCGGRFLEQAGFGTERVEAELRDGWPDARVARLDRDTVRRQGAAARLLQRFAARDVDLLVGTQMVAKGHDFPGVTLVGVISADVGLGVADFRAAERTFQLLTQVAGRAGRGDTPGEAIIQTLYPHHYSIRYACTQAYEPFYAEEIRYREEMRYPPVVALVSALVRGTTMARALGDAAGLAATLRRRPGHFRILGPAPAPLTRLRGQYRVQLLLKGPSRREMREAVQAALAEHPDLDRRTVLDVDPLSML